MRSWRIGPPPSAAAAQTTPANGQPAASLVSASAGVSANRSTGQSSNGQAGAAAAQQATPGGTPQADQINFVDLQYQGGLTGNVLRREFTFHDQVRSVYGPVATWDNELDPDNPAPGAVLLTCNALTAYQVPAQTLGRPAINMNATGNAAVEGQRLSGDTFRGWANEINYAQEKDLLMLKGDGRNDAQLYRQARPGAPLDKAIAQVIMYWRSTGHAEWDNVRVLDFSQFAAPPAPAGKKPASQPQR